MSCKPGPIRRDLIHFGIKKRVAGHLPGLAAIALRLGNLFRRRPEEKKMLILEPFGLGDVISFEPLVRALKGAGYQVAICGKREWKSLYPEDQQLTWIDAALPWVTYDETKKYFLSAYRSPAFRQCLRSLRLWANGAVGLDTRGDIRSVALLRLAGCRRVISLENYLGSNLRMTPGAAERVPFDHRLHRWELNLKFLSALAPDLTPPGNEGPSFPHLAGKAKPERNRLAFVAVAPWRGKLWSPEKWRELAGVIKAKGWEAIGLCGPGQTKAAREQLEEAPLKECNSIESWAEALGGCGAVVTLDSGPMHFADALGIPTVALFGQGKLPLWGPSGSRSCVISHQADADFVLCQPVEENSASGREFMDRISAREVAEAIEKVAG